MGADVGPQKSFEVFSKGTLAGVVAGLQAAPGTKEIVAGKGTALSMTVSAESGKIGKEYEMHEHRDHVFQVLEGSTVYELGGTLKGGRETKPGEWLAPGAEGFSTVALHKGDLLSIPRGTLHRRLTEGSVSLLLINTNPGV